MSYPTIKVFYFNPFRECTYVVSDEEGNAFLIDAGCSTLSERHRLVQYIEEKNLCVKAHLLTHAHLDHLFGAKFVFEKYGVLPYLHPDDTFFFSRQDMQSVAFGCPLIDEPLADFTPVHNGDVLYWCNLSIRVIHTPGHSAGSVCYYIQDTPTPILFSGDTLFAGSVGRTDLPTGNMESLRNSLHSRLFSLPEDTIVYPGHGADTTIAVEKRNGLLS